MILKNDLMLDYEVEVQKCVERLKLFYDEDRKNPFNEKLYDRISATEKRAGEFIINFDNERHSNEYRNKEEEMLKKIVSLSRRFLQGSMGINSNSDSLAQWCIYFTNIVKRICDEFGIENYPIDFVNGISNHTALLLKLKSGNYYVIDLTYQQFFLMGNNLEERHVTRKDGLVEGPYVGFHMMKNGFSTIARHIIEKGYISADEPGFKQYMDGFIIAFYYDRERDKYLRYNPNDYIDDIKKGKAIGNN